MRYVITGANRGLGLEFARQLLDRGDDLIATARRPDEAEDLQALKKKNSDKLEIYELDVTDADSIAELAEAVGDRSVDVLINNAAVLLRAGGLGDLDEDKLFKSFDVNTVGPLRVTGALLDALERGEGAKVVNITSKMGSMADNSSGGSYAYRISKAGLNMATRSMAIDLLPRGIVAFAIHPGWVQTRMGGFNALIDAETSISKMLGIIDSVGAESAGTFQEWSGGLIPW